MKRLLVVLDPGMREAGGHHATLVSSLSQTKLNGIEQVTFYSHVSFDENQTASAICCSKVAFSKHFETNHYKHYEDGYSLPFPIMQSYICQLSLEYISAIRLSLLEAKERNTENITFFYPCLNWEHANALSLAIQVSKQTDIHINHKICCMFTPHDKHDLRETFLYDLAFKRLSRHSSVELYASDIETQNFYENLEIPMKGIHPSYLLTWQDVAWAKKSESKKQKVLLYFGDAKINKGFCLLPELFENLCSQFDSNVDFIIHYTIAWGHEDLNETVLRLEELSKTNNRLTIFKQFWTDSQLIDCFKQLDLMYCTHCPITYFNKSSGVAWLAAFFRIPVVVSAESWITREFDRLEHKYYIEPSYGKVEVLELKHNEKNAYFKSIFASLGTWI